MRSRITIRPYGRCKRSGLPWVGAIPANWLTRRLKTIARLKAGDGITSEEIEPKGAFPVYGGNGLRGYSDRFTHEGAHALIGRQGALCGNVHHVEGRFWASEHAIVASPVAGIDARWLSRVLRSMNLGQYSVSAAQPGIGVESIRDLGVPLPPLDEQRAIADFLDGMDARITRFIAARRKMIALLEEKKQAVINQAVTCGLDPSIPMKDSGVDWLGEIPAHWDVHPLKSLSKKWIIGSTPQSDTLEFYENGSVPWYGPSSIQGSISVEAPVKTLPSIAFEQGGARLISPPALLVVVIGATLGKSALLLEQGSTNQQLLSFELKKNTVPRFIAEQFRLSREFLRSFASTATMPIIKTGLVANVPVALPPIKEQAEISDFIESEASRIEILITRHQREIELMQEYRTRLISDVVTGKLDVRGVELPVVEEVIGEEIEAAMEDEPVLTGMGIGDELD